jgi:hypothetical protein
VTIITAATPAGGGCSVRIDFFFGGDAVLACSLTDHVGKNRALNFCTRSTTKSYVSCAFTCSPELDFHQGKAVISTADTTACAKTDFEARLYYFNGTTGDDSVAGLSNSAVVPLN